MWRPRARNRVMMSPPVPIEPPSLRVHGSPPRDEGKGFGLFTCPLEAKAGTAHDRRMKEFTVRPDPDDPRLTRRVAGIDQEGKSIETAVVTERPLTLFLNGREIVTMMT